MSAHVNLYIIQKYTSISDSTRGIFLLFISFNVFLSTNQNGYWIIYFLLANQNGSMTHLLFMSQSKLIMTWFFFLYIETICFSLFSSTSSSHKKSLFSTPFSFLLFVYFLMTCYFLLWFLMLLFSTHIFF